MFADGAVEAEALESDECMIGPAYRGEIPDLSWTALRTNAEVNDKDKAGRTAVAKVGVRLSASVTGGGQVAAYAFLANWSDEGPNEGMVEDDEVACTGGSISSITVKD